MVWIGTGYCVGVGDSSASFDISIDGWYVWGVVDVGAGSEGPYWTIGYCSMAIMGFNVPVIGGV